MATRKRGGKVASKEGKKEKRTRENRSDYVMSISCVMLLTRWGFTIQILLAVGMACMLEVEPLAHYALRLCWTDIGLDHRRAVSDEAPRLPALDCVILVASLVTQHCDPPYRAIGYSYTYCIYIF